MEQTRPTHKAMAVRMIEAKGRRSFGEIIGAKRAQGRSFREIGKEYGIGHQTIWRHWKAWEKEHRHERTGP